MLKVLIALLTMTTVAWAQPAPSDNATTQRKARSLDTVAAQRNQAMDAIAICLGEYEEVKRQLDELKKTCPAHPPPAEH